MIDYAAGSCIDPDCTHIMAFVLHRRTLGHLTPFWVLGILLVHSAITVSHHPPDYPALSWPVTALPATRRPSGCSASPCPLQSFVSARALLITQHAPCHLVILPYVPLGSSGWSVPSRPLHALRFDLIPSSLPSPPDLNYCREGVPSRRVASGQESAERTGGILGGHDRA